MIQQHKLRVLVCTQELGRAHSICQGFDESVQATPFCTDQVNEDADAALVQLCRQIRKAQAHLVIIESALLPYTRENQETLLKEVESRRFVVLHDQPEASLEMILDIQRDDYWIIYDQTLHLQTTTQRLEDIAARGGKLSPAIENPDMLRRYAGEYFAGLSDPEIMLEEIESEFSEILRRLFPENRRISIEPIPLQKQPGNPMTSLVPRSRSQVFLVTFKVIVHSPSRNSGKIIQPAAE